VLKNNGFHNRHSPATRSFNPASLFANGEQGWVYDPSSLATLFQDSAGITPVTTMEQPVGLQLDLSGRNNHRFQTTLANRPLVSARVNLLTKTEQFDDAAWTKAVSTVVPNSGIAPDGTNTATLLTVTSTSEMYQQVNFAAGVTGDFALWVKAAASGSAQRARITTNNTTAWNTGISQAITLTNEWQKIILSGSMISSGAVVRAIVTSYDASRTSDSTCVGNVLIWGADLRVSNQGVDLPAYQRVNTSTDYDSTGFPVYIKPNGANQFLMTNSIDFTSTDEISVWQGVRKLRDSAQSVIAELSSSVAANNGAFLLSAPNSAAANYNFSSKGTSQADNIVATYASPITNVLAAAGDISGASNSIKINGGAATVITSSQGTGTYGNYAAYFYMRAGALLPFNGNDYGRIVRGAASTAAQN